MHPKSETHGFHGIEIWQICGRFSIGQTSAWRLSRPSIDLALVFHHLGRPDGCQRAFGPIQTISNWESIPIPPLGFCFGPLFLCFMKALALKQRRKQVTSHLADITSILLVALAHHHHHCNYFIHECFNIIMRPTTIFIVDNIVNISFGSKQLGASGGINLWAAVPPCLLRYKRQAEPFQLYSLLCFTAGRERRRETTPGDACKRRSFSKQGRELI